LRRWDGFGDPIVEIVTNRRLPSRSHIVIHHVAGLPPQAVERVDGIPTTSPARTLLQLGAVSDVMLVELALEDALRRRQVSLARLRWELNNFGGKGVRGTEVLRHLLSERGPGYRPRKSALEIRVFRAIKSAGLPLPIYEHPIRTPSGVWIRPDFCYPSLWLAIECESYRYHGGRQVWLRDVERYETLRRMGWTVIRVTVESIEPDPSEFIADLSAYLGGLLFNPADA
jgi:hypothetical protein